MPERSNEPGSAVIVGHLSVSEQQTLLSLLDAIVARAPYFVPTMPRWGTPLSVRMSNCGVLGWVSDKKGYRYQPLHPDTGEMWPAMPEMLHDIWDRYTSNGAPPEACLINYYGPKARMGLHQDRDEHDFGAPVLSISLGDSARFALGGMNRDDPVTRFELVSGDIMVLDGARRLAFHGVDRIYPGTGPFLATHERLMPHGGRINLTLRRVGTAAGT